MRFTLGEMIYRFRIERGIEASQICRGLCSTSAMNYFENGERVPDTLLFECLVERMGVSPEEFSLMVTEKEYIYHVWKEKVYNAIKTEAWELLRELLQSEISKKVYCNAKLEKQFSSYVKGIYHASQGQYMEAKYYLEIAQKQTLLEKCMLQKRNILLSTMELNILMLELYYGSKADDFNGSESVEIFHRLESYIYSDTLDVNEQAKYPWTGITGGRCENSLYGRYNGFVLFVGTGDTPPTPDDYKLENAVELGVLTASCIHYANGRTIVSREFFNNTDENVTIKEIGCYIFTNSNPHQPLVMIARRVLPNPVVIPDGQNYAFTYTIDTSRISFEEADD